MKTFIFDMDGTIIDSEEKWLNHEAELLSQHTDNWDIKDYGKITGMSVPQMYSTLVKDFGFKMPLEEFLSINKSMAIEIYSNEVNLMPGFLDLLKYLKKQGHKIALASSSPMLCIDIVIKRFELEQYFDHIVSADHVNGIGKPDPAIYNYTKDLLKVDACDCIVLEDSTHGINAANSAGMYSIAYLNGVNGEQKLDQSNKVINNFNQLIDFNFETLSL
ncbi:MAG: haloacid dehalogenase [Candidatus Cloacimonadota bacterium]|nr:MAG: haloacid dehalogenase [Candidatus Cloacimonadota bacterium]